MSIVVPLRDEEPTLRALFQSVCRVLEGADLTFEMIFVDDGSTDGSVATLTRLAAQDGRVRVLMLRRNFGKAAALATGFRAATGTYVITMDADLQDDPAEIPRLVSTLQAGFDLVSGWKRKRQDPLRRRLASRVFNSTTRRLSGVSLHDFNCGLKAYTAGCAKEIAESCYGELHRYLPVLAHWRGYRVTELAVNHRPRTNGRSRYGLERYVRGFLDLLTALFLSRYARRPMHVFGGTGLILLAPAGLVLSFLSVRKLAFGVSIGPGRPLLIITAVLFIAGLQLILSGLVAEMLSGARASTVPSSSVWPSPEVERRRTPDRRRVADRRQTESPALVLSLDDMPGEAILQ